MPVCLYIGHSWKIKKPIHLPGCAAFYLWCLWSSFRRVQSTTAAVSYKFSCWLSIFFSGLFFRLECAAACACLVPAFGKILRAYNFRALQVVVPTYTRYRANCHSNRPSEKKKRRSITPIVGSMRIKSTVNWALSSGKTCDHLHDNGFSFNVQPQSTPASILRWRTCSIDIYVSVLCCLWFC